MNLFPLRQYIIDQAFTTLPVFVHEMPARVTEGVLVLPKLSGANYDPELPGYYKTGFQVIVRHTGYQEAYAEAMKLFDGLKSEQEIVLPEYTIFYLRPKHLPVSYPRSEGHQVESSVNIDIGFRE